MKAIVPKTPTAMKIGATKTSAATNSFGTAGSLRPALRQSSSKVSRIR